MIKIHAFNGCSVGHAWGRLIYFNYVLSLLSRELFFCCPNNAGTRYPGTVLVQVTCALMMETTMVVFVIDFSTTNRNTEPFFCYDVYYAVIYEYTKKRHVICIW